MASIEYIVTHTVRYGEVYRRIYNDRARAEACLGQFGVVVTNRGLPAIDEVRTWMRDSDSNDNYLLRTLEFTAEGAK